MPPKLDLETEVHGYQVGPKIGSGGVGTVYKFLKDGRTYAGKISPNIKANRKEVEVLKDLATPHCHPLIICYVDSFKWQKQLILVMDYFDGYTLTAMLDMDDLPSEDIVTVYQHILEGLVYLHGRHYAHCDLKLENVLFNPRGLRLNLIDVGMACGPICSPYYRRGTLIYWPPEDPPPFDYNPDVLTTTYRARPVEVQGSALLGFQKADIFALGLMMYELGRGEIFDAIGPYSNKQLFDLQRDRELVLFPANVDLSIVSNLLLGSMIQKSLMPDPEMRPTARQVLDMVEEV